VKNASGIASPWRFLATPMCMFLTTTNAQLVDYACQYALPRLFRGSSLRKEHMAKQNK